ncbi:MAG TPA: SWIB/MDM2 domain-containing protein [Candidatus Thermoplasmatota archaeon]|nr:SWIB/MDM2 domain-containing protein [Candidatus Thermoplasmatota archaeon]
MKPVKLSPELAAIVGKNEAPRTEVTKKIWAYIKKTKGAQDGRTINPSADPKLKAVLGDKPIDMLKMTSVLNSKHMKG